MIVFAIVSVACLALFIFELTNVKKAQEQAQRTQLQLSSQGNPPAYYRDEASARKSTAFEVMSKDLSTLAHLVNGHPESVAPAVKADAEAVLSKLAEAKYAGVAPNDTLLGALRRMDTQLASATGTVQSLTAELTDAQTQNESLSNAIKATRDEFEAQVAALNERITQLQDEMNTALAQKDEQIKQLESQATSAGEVANQERVAWQKEKRQMELDLGRAQNQIAELQKQIQDLKPGSFDPEAILRKADGRILRAIPGSDIVYINRGSDDNVKVGMGFEVYGQARETNPGLRGKASLEVAAVMPQTAECRVTRATPGQPIVESDIVVNIAYERGRMPKFVVVGEFDLDYDGNADFDGVERIRAIIRQWGGQVVEDLDETTDFVVVGAAPYVPKMSAEENVSPQVAEQIRDQQLQRSRFRDLIERARTMYVPVITQNQFLFLTGYADAAAVPR